MNSVTIKNKIIFLCTYIGCKLLYYVWIFKIMSIKNVTWKSVEFLLVLLCTKWVAVVTQSVRAFASYSFVPEVAYSFISHTVLFMILSRVSFHLHFCSWCFLQCCFCKSNVHCTTFNNICHITESLCYSTPPVMDIEHYGTKNP